VLLAYEILNTNEDPSYLIVGVLPEASFRPTIVEGDIPSTKSKLSAPTIATLYLLNGVKFLA
jgi:hypothetical protein